ncbi:MAG: sugar nucleotide-binding protein [Burkholderiales bacterium]|jgi:dTDP-4-dehydrorhamnose reductase|nr:sugar nucleotide-binding protein [Burkholderiales bacterium]
MRRILVTGRGGQLATGLEAALPAQGFEALLVGQPEFEFEQPESVIAAFQALKPDAVVNCAAWTAVDADATLAIQWPTGIQPILSAKDAQGKPFIETEVFA